MKAIKLSYKNVPFTGRQIYADIAEGFNFVEYKTKAGKHPVLIKHNHLIGYEPFTQFPLKEYEEMMDQLFIEMVVAWNEKH